MATAPDAAVGFLLQNLKEFVKWNTDLIAGVQDNIMQLIQELQKLEVFLIQCREAYNDDEYLDILAKDVRKLVYRAEDAIEIYIVAASKQKSRGTVRSALHAVDHAMELRNVGKELESIKEEVQKINSTKFDLGFGALRLDSAREQEHTIKKPSIGDDMVGFDDAMNYVIGRLSEGPDDLEIISIVGMFGLGKTTLARKVFSHPTVEYLFFIRAFVEVSAEYTEKEVFLKILHGIGFSNEAMNRMSTDDLAREIRNELEKMKFLIVLDDVWTGEAWDHLRKAFPDNQKHCRVLITTRNKSVAEHARRGLEPYALRFLTHPESLELLRLRVFGKDPFPADLEPYAARILDRCEGLPLAIVVTAGILINNRTEGYWWKKVAEDLDMFNLAAQRQLSHVIDLSFKNMPYYLKTCFLYIGVFHAGSEIPSKTLLQLWVSEGFVLPVDGPKKLEDRAEDYLEELVARSLVTVGKRRLDGRIKTIWIQNTLREFCKMQAKKEELFREIRMSEYGSTISPYEDRRLCINSNVLEYINSKPSGKYVRSFLSFAKEQCFLPIDCISVIPKAFRLVRVLDIRSMVLIRFPPELYYLFLLKYIAMSTQLKAIPEKMSNLRYLQTLIYKTTYRALEIKADIWKMAHLRHLETNASTSLVKTREASSINSNLQTLSEISPESCCKEVFDRSPQLKKLGIRGKLGSTFEALLKILPNLGSLENLKLFNDDAAVKLCSLPSENRFPANLTRLTLQNTMFDWGCMSTLAKLKKLVVLKLKDNAFVGSHWEAKHDGFPALEVLHIGCTDLITWRASASYFPSLTQLYLMHCTKLEAVPSDLVNISALRWIHIYCCKPSVASSARDLLGKRQLQAQDKDDKSSASLKLSIYPPAQ